MKEIFGSLMQVQCILCQYNGWFSESDKRNNGFKNKFAAGRKRNIL